MDYQYTLLPERGNIQFFNTIKTASRKRKQKKLPPFPTVYKRLWGMHFVAFAMTEHGLSTKKGEKPSTSEWTLREVSNLLAWMGCWVVAPWPQELLAAHKGGMIAFSMAQEDLLLSFVLACSLALSRHTDPGTSSHTPGWSGSEAGHKQLWWFQRDWEGVCNARGQEDRRISV